jgi:uncharacterized protein (TIRG00374 family)
MSRRVRLLALALGLALFGYLLSHVGLRELAVNARRTGWMLAPVLAVWGGVYACNAAAWRLILADDSGAPRFARIYAATISGFAINYLTPFISLGGEPLKIAAATEWLGDARRAAASVVTSRLIFTIGHLLSMLSAVVLGVIFFPRNPVTIIALAGFGLLLGLLLGLVLMVHRQGMLERTLNFLHRTPGLGKLAGIIEPRREALAEMDQHITSFHHASPRRFWMAVALEYMGRALMMLEYFLILRSVGTPASYFDAYLIGSFTSVVGIVLFIVPFDVGTKEGGFYAVFRALGLDPHLGIYTSVISRVRELAWILVGLGLLALQSGRTGASRGKG